MFSNIKGVHRLWPDKDRLIYHDEFLGKRGPNLLLLGVDNLSFRSFVPTRLARSDAIFFDRLERISILLGLTILFAGKGLAASASVTLAWTTDTDPTVVGYNLVYGTSSISLNQKVNVGKVTTATVSALTAGRTYYFAVTAYNLAGVNSAKSNEVSFKPNAASTPTPKPTPTPTPKLTPTPTPGSAPPVAKSDSGFVTMENTSFPIAASALLANDTDPHSYSLSITGVGNAVNGTVSYNASTKIVTFVPSAGYTGAASFTYAISNGHGGTAIASVILIVNLPTASLFSANEAPVSAALNDGRPLVLGVKFQTSTAGTIKGIRFYKSRLSTGTHVGTLWSSAGTLLASATFANETASGWQQVNLPSPVRLTPGTTYIVSYNTNNYYCADLQYFSKALTSGPLSAPASSASGGNGVYIYASASTFPKDSYSSCNYWVDVAFAPTAKQPPVARNDSGFVAAENSSLSVPASALLGNDTDPNAYPLAITGVSNPTHGSVTYNGNTGIVTFTPSTNYTGPANFSYTIKNTASQTASATVSIAVTPKTSTWSLFSATSAPATITWADPTPVELGVKFQTSAAGTVTGIRFYKGLPNIGPHVASLWTATGTLLATATFTNETASGWQQVNLPKPVTLAPLTTYVVAYHTNGFYSADSNYFAKALKSGPLTAPASFANAGNGVYAYGSTGIFPVSTYASSNYWVDVVFNQIP